MPVYNCELYIQESVTSILSQTYKDFEFIIIDDGSSDGTFNYLESLQDDRIILIQKPINTGLTNSLNIGLQRARGKYIARMDGDDIALPTRFEKQCAFMDNNPDMVACGTNYEIMHTINNSDHPCDPDDLKVQLLSDCYIAHPSVMLRRETLIENKIEYDIECEPAEDYNLWVKLLKYGKISNIKESLVKYRLHETQISNTRAKQQMAQADKARLAMIAQLTDKNDLHSREIHLAIIKTEKNPNITLSDAEEWIENLKKSNLRLRIYDRKKFDAFLEYKRVNYIKLHFLFRKGADAAVIRQLFFTSKKYYRYFNLFQLSKIAGKCIFYYGHKN
jgi:glycosyltransferase involved in cell wall biosynthesis